jgi:hypothetical protein
MFWEQGVNRLHKIFKIPGLGHLDHNDRNSNFQPFPLDFEFQTKPSLYYIKAL